ncbi:hypothetical protein TNCV_11681 [Trichonephila clavipes]|nr:hypothetical protein TNCV_11681 [Trichonephila clavipes]
MEVTAWIVRRIEVNASDWLIMLYNLDARSKSRSLALTAEEETSCLALPCRRRSILPCREDSKLVRHD